MRRRTFLELVAAAPLAALVPWRPASAMTSAIDWGVGLDSTVLVVSAFGAAGRHYVVGEVLPHERLTRLEFTGDAVVLHVAESGVWPRWRPVVVLRDVWGGPVIVSRHKQPTGVQFAEEQIMRVDRPFLYPGDRARAWRAAFGGMGAAAPLVGSRILGVEKGLGVKSRPI